MVTWVNDELPAINATNLNRMEAGIDNALQLIKQFHPTLQILEAIDGATQSYIHREDTFYLLVSYLFDSYDEHNDNSVNGALWTITTEEFAHGTREHTVTEENSEYMLVHTYLDLPGTSPSGKSIAYVTSDESYARWHSKLKHYQSGGGYSRLYFLGNSTHYVTLPTDNAYHDYVITIDADRNKVLFYKDDVLILEETETANSGQIRYYSYCYVGTPGPGTETNDIYCDKTGKTGTTYAEADALNGNLLTAELAADSAVLSFFKHLKGKFSNGDSSHATPVQAEIFGDADSYAAALNGTTKFTIAPSDPRIELLREDTSEVAKGAEQTTWVMDDNVTNGALPAKTGATHSTILAEEIGVASIIAVEKSVLGDFTDTVVLAEDDDYVVDYSTRTATEIILTDGTGITTSSKLRITWIADVMDIDAGTNNTALKIKLYLNRTSTDEASPEIQPLDIGTSKYAEMLYGT